MTIIVRTTAGLLAFGCLSAAQAQDSSDGVSAGAVETATGIETVHVTARLRPEDILDVPFALTTFDAEMLDRRRIDDSFSFFRHAPGLSLTSFDDGRFAYYQPRGIGPLFQAIGPDDGSVVTYVDGVPQPVFASEFAYLDLERMEVLRGPQGTLFGRNSQGGAIHITTRAPADIFAEAIDIERMHWRVSYSASFEGVELDRQCSDYVCWVASPGQILAEAARHDLTGIEKGNVVVLLR